jgi:hypothetical protein
MEGERVVEGTEAVGGREPGGGRPVLNGAARSVFRLGYPGVVELEEDRMGVEVMVGGGAEAAGWA